MKKSVVIAISFCHLACSSNYATWDEVEYEIGRVDAKVEAVEFRRAVSDSRFEFDLSATTNRLGWVEKRQLQAEKVIEAMGDGFNVLTEELETTQKQTAKVEQRQNRLEKRVESKFKPVLTRAFEKTNAREDEVAVLIGAGENLTTGEKLPPLRLILDDPPILRRMTDEKSYVEFIPTREVGNRIYGLSEDPSQSLCLEVIDRPDDGVEFTAADCKNPFLLYRFRVE